MSISRVCSAGVLLAAFLLAARAVAVSEPVTWTVRLAQSGGLRGTDSAVEVESTGRSRRFQGGHELCSVAIDPQAKQKIETTVKACQPSDWRKRYAGFGGGKGAGDQVTSTLTLKRHSPGGPVVETAVSWVEDAPDLPDDLRQLVLALSPLGEGSLACTE